MKSYCKIKMKRGQIVIFPYMLRVSIVLNFLAFMAKCSYRAKCFTSSYL